MLHRKTLAIIVTILALTCTAARGDWAVAGAAYKCDKLNGSFSIEATMDTSSPEDAGTVRPPHGFVELKPEKETQLKCSLKRTNIEASIHVYGPRAQGMCAGTGSVFVRRLDVNGRAVLPTPEELGTACPSGPGLIAVRIRVKGAKTSVELCRGDWDWGVGFTDIQCQTTSTPNPSFQRTASGGR